MGICPSLSPEQRTTKQHNKYLRKLLLDKLKDLSIYNFATPLRTQINNMQKRWLYNQGILQDIDNLIHIVQMKKSIKTQSLTIEAIDQQLRNSCLIMQDQYYKQKNQINSNNISGQNISQQNMNKQGDKNIQAIMPSNQTSQYKKNLAQNQSLVCQINIIYQKQFDINCYHNSLKLFLKWSSIFTEHFYGGFLKNIYRKFCQVLYQIDMDDIDTIVDQTSVFVQYMVGIYTDIYHLRQINQSQHGMLFKNQNIFNLIMACIFKKTKIKRFIRKVIQDKQDTKIKRFKQKLQEIKDKDIEFFQVQPKFQLKPPKQPNQINNITQYNSQKQQLIPKHPYSSCFRLIQNLCQNSQTPITKLKIIVQISKNITDQIYKYYDNLEKQVPQLDPDNLTGIIMYLIVKVNRGNLYEELKVAEYFTTGNCLTCISGYYLNVFNAAIQTLLTL